MRKVLLLFIGYCFITTTFAQTPEQKLQSLGIVLPAPTNPIANYVKFVRTGNLIFLSGHGPANADGKYTTGKLGKELSIEEGYNAAKLTGINLLSTLKAAVGDLSKVKRIVKVLGMVNSTEQFTDQPKVINGFSDLMVAIFGDKGKHARSAVGIASLPMNMAVEIEMIVEVEN
ncbi:MAG: RidA family protein [Sediminibacterium sp.]|jgi:enamine deaminase RidA (YjgF/YER057c/UK114 family)|uniref:RidA family protein n=1 Tax=Sediminibacterium sp. TaxID=1917865 RepID=UPI002ABCDB1D|nr:RidA family protein [Sediminibacterium sp.]MDZ4072771.1 RidA family protein [Sediminibacterium sp.]